MNVLAAVTTSSPGPTPNARSASSIASKPVPTPIAWRVPMKRGEFRLEALDRRAEDEIAALDDARGSPGRCRGEIGACCARRSTNGTCMVAIIVSSRGPDRPRA